MCIKEGRYGEAAFLSGKIGVGVANHILVKFVDHREVDDVDVVFVGGVALIILANVRVCHFL